MTEGMKFDDEKNRWDLLPFDVMDEVVKILTFGAKKYEDNNWKKISPERYKAALMRHYSAWVQGEKNDGESGLSHMSHVICNAIFLRWLQDD